jgi:hypothetical protein
MFWFIVWLAVFLATELLLGMLSAPAIVNIIVANNALWVFVIFALLKHFKTITSHIREIAIDAIHSNTRALENAGAGVQAGFDAVKAGFEATEVAIKSVAFISATRAEIDAAIRSGRAMWIDEKQETLLLDTGVTGPVEYTN